MIVIMHLLNEKQKWRVDVSDLQNTSKWGNSNWCTHTTKSTTKWKKKDQRDNVIWDKISPQSHVWDVMMKRQVMKLEFSRGQISCLGIEVPKKLDLWRSLLSKSATNVIFSSILGVLHWTSFGRRINLIQWRTKFPPIILLHFPTILDRCTSLP